MDTSHIFRNICRHIELNEDERSFFISLLSCKTIGRRKFILEEGQICDRINYIHHGAFRAFYRDAESHESMVMFGIDDWWITDMYSFTTREPAMLHIEALEESVIIELTREAFDQLLVKVPKFERFFRIIMQNSYVREQVRMLQNLSLTAAERYEQFLKKYPAVAQRIPQKHIASYLGITPEFLSAIRKNYRPD